MSWINGNGFIPNDGLNGTAAPWAAPTGGTWGPFPPGSPGYLGGASSDAVRPAWFGGAADPFAAFGATLPGGAINPGSNAGISGVLAQLAAQVQQSIAKLSNALMGSFAAPNPNAMSGSATFGNVSLASSGDPHLSVSGTEQNADGSTAGVNSHFDSMTSHADLFSTRDFGDGFHVSTTVTQPGANGITQNAGAVASMDGGRESVTMTSDGTISVLDHGQAVALTAGQSLRLLGGQQVAENANGSVSVSETSFGENLTTTFTANGGGGVDVSASGENVTLGGDLITGGTTPAAQPIAQVRRPPAFI